MATGVGDIFLDLKLNKQPFEKGLNETKNSAGRIGGMIGSKMGLALAGAITTAVAGISFASLISKTTQLGDTIDKMSQKMGMSTQAYQEWDYIMQICGSDIESLKMSMKTLASSAETSKDALSELGISQEQLANLSQEDLFALVISRLQQVTDTTKRTYLAGQLLGRGATELGALLNQSSQQTEALRQNFYALGGAMSQTAVSNSAQLADAMTDVKMSLRGIYNTIAETILPTITRAINGIIIPAIQRACAIVRYFGSLWNSIFGGIAKRTSFLGKAVGKVKGTISSAFGKAQQKQNSKMAKSLGGVSKGVGGTGKSAKKAKKAVKELTRELMGFDKINKLAKKNNDSAGGGAGGGGGGGGVGDLGGFEDELGGVNDKLFDFSKISEKIAPIWKALKGVFEAVIRLFKAVVKALAPVGKFIWKHLIKPFGKLLSMAIVAVLDGIAGAIELLAMFIEKHPKISATIMTIAGALLAIIKAGGVLGILSKVAKLFGTLGAVLMAHPIIAIITGIALAIGYIYKHWDKIKKTKFGKLLIKVGNTLKKIGSYIAGTFLKKFEEAKKLVQGFKEAWTGIKSKAVELKAKVGEVAGDIWEGITDATATITIGLQDNFSSAWNAIKDTWNGLKDKAVEAWTSLKDTFSSAWNNIKGLWNGIASRTESVTTKLVDYFSSAWNNIKGKWNDVKSKTATLTVDIRAKLANGWNSLVKKLRGAKLKVIKNFGKSLPLLAEGGWVDKNTPQLAVVGDNRHESEIVAPDSKLSAMARQAAQEASGAGNAQVINLLAQILSTVAGLDTNVYLDGKEIASSTVRRINQQTRTTGQFPLIV